ncbi:MAG: response regulator [Cyclobacteriaceae bacterium]
MKILVIDDNDVDITIFSRVIEKKDPTIEVNTVCNGREGLEYLANEKSPPDLIFLDLFMPETDGWYFLEHYQDLKLEKLPVLLVVSSSINPRDKQMSTDYPFVSAYLTKPFLPQVFEEALEIYRRESAKK